ncbi:hypothetical protein OBBRIDRAFT_793667 [Obba rivulosa]|uniref:Uncharacterized protein n=1 Tax=Obba rivulosa TaxID=1052685 RepID=A0A8E2AVP2_9APHY|nr:hypothetical protein OBBRIDRAFT_793667 [Obba rivulosa]
MTSHSTRSARTLSDISVAGSPRRSDYRVLTPRTPHSRAGRAEEGYTEIELEQLDHEDDSDATQQQSRPLLGPNPGSSSPAGYRSRGDDHDILRKYSGPRHALSVVLHKSPLILGSILAGLLLSMIAVSLRKPGAIETIWGQKAEEDLDTPVSYVDSVPPEGRVISYENYTRFPLTGSEYLRECTNVMGGFMHHMGYWLPPKMGPLDVPHHDAIAGDGHPIACSSSITYMLDGHVGLAADLALMAQAAGMAREQNRTFFVEDRYWNRGKWSDHFQDVHALEQGPEPGCQPPPPEELVACPRVARHWVISSQTAKYHFGHEFFEEFEDPFSRQLNRQRPIFERARESFAQTIRPNAHNTELIKAARAEMAAILSLTPDSPPQARSADDAAPPSAPSPYIAIHIRRGDQTAKSWKHHKGYVPLEDYVQAARDTWTRLFAGTPAAAPANPEPAQFPAPPITYVASDAPEALRGFTGAFPPETALFALATSTRAELRALAPHHEYNQTAFGAEDEEERVRLTRGMVVDFAMLSGLWAEKGEVVPGAVVCTVRSNACKLAALGLGFDRAFGFDDGADHIAGSINEEGRRWVEIDNRDQVVPIWTGFELYH